LPEVIVTNSPLGDSPERLVRGLMLT